VVSPTAASLKIYVHDTGSDGILHEIIVDWDDTSTVSSVGMNGTGISNTGVWDTTAVTNVQGSGSPLVF
jgi:hypothetical protein